MRPFYTPFAILLFFLCLLSCREVIENQHNSVPKEKKVPSSEQNQIGKPIPKFDSKKQVDPQPSEELQKKKKKTSDTLRPLVAIP